MSKLSLEAATQQQEQQQQQQQQPQQQQHVCCKYNNCNHTPTATLEQQPLFADGSSLSLKSRQTPALVSQQTGYPVSATKLASQPPLPIRIFVDRQDDESVRCDCRNCQFLSGWCCMPCALLIVILLIVVWVTSSRVSSPNHDELNNINKSMLTTVATTTASASTSTSQLTSMKSVDSLNVSSSVRPRAFFGADLEPFDAIL